ncbi:uncharacterized protein BDR25DRAFT_354662 [Lindgomyces ingoldianus]|uniref:Uncharacterized protein n=1 Tax=Lindgomyces ingoldianus TaxID=673940 RepID=A0ACB6QWN3_9PLEO|nr:uncharacterized protein BDR25DRAFT_354662 [Lindgomyces ingoldianus]KAF2471423.1 hypothetical protein BDR25DRAFT_354662 [Lindgomyces ingoldianus]
MARLKSVVFRLANDQRSGGLVMDVFALSNVRAALEQEARLANELQQYINNAQSDLLVAAKDDIQATSPEATKYNNPTQPQNLALGIYFTVNLAFGLHNLNHRIPARLGARTKLPHGAPRLVVPQKIWALWTNMRFLEIYRAWDRGSVCHHGSNRSQSPKQEDLMAFSSWDSCDWGSGPNANFEIIVPEDVFTQFTLLDQEARTASKRGIDSPTIPTE